MEGQAGSAVNMTQQRLMSQRETPDPLDPNPRCPGEVDAVTTGFWDDLHWTIYVCQVCHTPVAAVGGAPYWWNHVLSQASRERLGV
jgi:hypothetical protein